MMKNISIKDPSVVLLTAYFTIGILLQLVFSVDIFPPCLFSYIFDIHCPGCGLTGAAVHLAKFEFSGAWESNPLIYLIVPVFLREFYTFIRSLSRIDQISA